MVWTKGVREETDEKEKLRSWWRPIGGGERKETNQGYCRAACRWAGKWRPHSIQVRGPKKGLLRREGHSLKRRWIWFQAYRFYRLSANPAPPGAHPPECEGPALGAWKREGSSSSLVEASQNRSRAGGRNAPASGIWRVYFIASMEISPRSSEGRDVDAQRGPWRYVCECIYNPRLFFFAYFQIALFTQLFPNSASLFIFVLAGNRGEGSAF